MTVNTIPPTHTGTIPALTPLDLLMNGVVAEWLHGHVSFDLDGYTARCTYCSYASAPVTRRAIAQYNLESHVKANHGESPELSPIW